MVTLLRDKPPEPQQPIPQSMALRINQLINLQQFKEAKAIASEWGVALIGLPDS